jgi:outer membrane receptor protein involved in Fe transport
MTPGRVTALIVIQIGSWPAGLRAENSPGQADVEPIEVSGLELESLLDLEVSAATRTPVKISELPSTGSALTREQLRDYGWHSINELLYTLPGFFVSQDYERVLPGFRGERERWNANRLLLAIDDLPHNDIQDGSAFTWETTPLFFARRVEVVRGPASAVYGSNAMHGVVAIETVTAEDLDGRGVEARLRVGPVNQSVDAVGGTRGSWADAVIGFSAQSSEGHDYLDPDDSYRTDESGALAMFPIQDQINGSYLWMKVSPHGPATGLDISIHRQSEQTETGRGWSFWSPDIDEFVRERRLIVETRYRRALDRVKVEAAAQFQRENYEAQIRHYPAGAFDGLYPQGVTEGVDTHFDGALVRGQAELAAGRGATVMGGVEYGAVLYSGDRAHYANAQLVDPTGEFPQLDEFAPLAPTFEPILDRPVHRVGVYSQAVSGQLFGPRVEVTLGARFDDLFYRYEDVADPERPVISDSHRRLSPRAALLVRPSESVRLKLLVGHAFRTPNIIELFSANSWTGSSSPATLRPETTTSYEAAVDWAAAASLRARANAFYIDHRDSIDYAPVTGLLQNIFSNRRAGAEVELLGETRVGPLALDGFASYSYVRLIDETLLSPDWTPSNDLVWAPRHLVKAGMRLNHRRFGLTATAYYQGKTHRRASDRTEPMWNEQRPFDVPGWVTTSSTVFFRPHPGVKVGIEGRNVLDIRGPVISPEAHGFDYRIPPRQLLGVIELDL